MTALTFPPETSSSTSIETDANDRGLWLYVNLDVDGGGAEFIIEGWGTPTHRVHLSPQGVQQLVAFLA